MEMDREVLSKRDFTIYSCIEDESHCFIVIKNGFDGFAVFDALNESEYIEALSCNRKARFIMDVHSFLDCAVIEVAYREDCKLCDLLPIETVANAETLLIIEKLND